MPTLTVIGGPNGAGKSTLTKTAKFEGREHLLDPDAIARRLDENVGWTGFAAGREVTRLLTLLPDSPLAYVEWKRLVSRYGVMGVQVNDARMHG